MIEHPPSRCGPSWRGPASRVDIGQTYTCPAGAATTVRRLRLNPAAARAVKTAGMAISDVKILSRPSVTANNTPFKFDGGEQPPRFKRSSNALAQGGPYAVFRRPKRPARPRASTTPAKPSAMYANDDASGTLGTLLPR